MTTREPLPGYAAWRKNLLMIGAVFGGFCIIAGGADLFRTLVQEQRSLERPKRSRAGPAGSDLLFDLLVPTK